MPTPTLDLSCNVVGLLGDQGGLASALAAEAGSWFRTVRLDVATLADRTGGVSAMLAVSNAPDADWYARLRRVCSAAGIPALTVYAERNQLIVASATSGCITCLQLRRRRAHKHARDDQVVRDHHRHRLPVAPSSPALAAELAAGLVCHELIRNLRSAADGPGPGVHTFLRVDLADLGVHRHRYLPDPGCPDCGGLPEDSARSAWITLRSRPKPDRAVFRARDVAAHATAVRDTYVDESAGVVRTPRAVRDAPLIRAVAPLSSLRGNESQHGWGRTLDLRSAELTAVLEALERMGGERPGGKRTVARGSYRELARDALNPRDLGLYPDERHSLPGFPFQRYSDDLVFPWVWGFSFARRAPVLVPEDYAYYALSRSAGGARFVYEISNGCALGNCLEEAILYGLLEVAERDAFLMTWYAQMPVPRMDLDSARDRTIPLIAGHLKRATGYDISVFTVTVEQRIPCFWAMAVDSAAQTRRPRALCAGGSAISAEKGVVNALHELTHLLDHVGVYGKGRQRERAAQMVADPSLVTKMSEHSLLYSHEAAFDRFGFMLDRPTVRTFADFADVWRWPPSTDLRDDLTEMLGRHLPRGMDVIVVDQTTPEHRAGGFSCVKVIVPGTLPMTFGHHARRIDGLPRLLQVPYELGYRDRPLTLADINAHPHPFP